MKAGNIAGIVLSLILIYGCECTQPEEVLLPRTDISLTVKGKTQMAYDLESCQIGYNNLKHEFRLVNDKLTDWMLFRCDAAPTDVGQKVKAYLEYTVSDDTRKMNDLTFTVKKTDTDGLVWLWNQDKKIGVIIKVLIN